MSKFKWKKLRKNKPKINTKTCKSPSPEIEREEMTTIFQEPSSLNREESLEARITALENPILDTIRPQGVLGVLESEGYTGWEIKKAISFIVQLDRAGALNNLNALMGSPVYMYG